MQNYIQLLTTNYVFNTIEDIARGWNNIPKIDIKKHWDEVRDVMLIHTQGLCPDRYHFGIISDDRTSWEEYEWRRGIYKPFSKEIFMRGLTMVSHIFKESEYQINSSPKTMEYMGRNIFGGDDLMTYYQTKVFQKQTEDPNGFLVILPIGDGMKQLLSQERVTQTLEPYPFCIASKSVKYIDTNWFIFEEHKGVYIAISKTEIWRLDVYEDRVNPTLLFQHNFNELPIIQLGGLWNNTGFYESWFSPALPSANELLRVYSDWQVAERRMYYTIEHEYIPCDYKDTSIGATCNEGKIRINGGQTQLCPRCSGTGSFVRFNPFYSIQRARTDNVTSNVNNRPFVDFRSPEAHPYDLLEKSVERLKSDTEKILHLKYIDEAQSGVAKGIDRQDKYAFMDMIARRFFNVLVYKTIYFFERYLNPNDKPIIEVKMPLQFNILSPAELQAEAKIYMNEVPIPFLALNSIKKLINNQIKGNDVEQKKLEVLINFDKLFAVGELNQNTGVAIGAIDKRTYLIHLTAPAELENIIKEKGMIWFNESNIDVILQELEKRYPKETQTTPTDVIASTQSQLNEDEKEIDEDETETEDED